MLRGGVRRLLEAEGGSCVVGEAADGWRALSMLEDPALEVDVVVLDLSMPGLNGLETLARLRKLRPSLPVLVVSMHSEEQYAHRVLAAGAAGYVSKSRTETELLEGIRAVAAGRVFTQRAHLGPAAGPEASLTPREHMLFTLLVGGSTVSEIAAELNLSKSTVSTHLGRVKAKLGVDSLAGLVAYAHRTGLID